MQDLLYRTSIYGPRRTLYSLPFGMDVGRQSEITYHFYNVDPEEYGALRATGAARKIENSGLFFEKLQREDGNAIIKSVMLGLIPGHNAKQTLKNGNADEVVTEAIERGEISDITPQIFEHAVLPFRESPLSGKTIAEIARNPTAIAVFVVVATGGSPVAIIVLPVGIVAIHVATRSAPTISRWVDKKLKEWLR